MFHIDICLYSLFYIVLVYVYTYCIFMYLRLFFPLGGTGRDDIAARLLLHQLHTTAEANHSLRTDSLNLWKSFFWLVKLFDLKMFGMSFDICHLFFFRLWEVGIDSAMLEFLRNGSTKILETSLSSESDSTGCHDVPCHRTSVIFPNKTSNIHVCCLRRVVTGLTCGSGDMLAQGKRFCSGVFWKTHVTWLGWRLYCIWKEWCKKPHQWD